jgi:hypothetical protein
MTVELTPAYDGDTGQVMMDGLPTGAAGEAGLVPARGLELIFDRADGRLARVVIDTAEPGGPVGPGSPAGAGEAAGLLTRLFGQDASDAVRRAARKQSARRALAPESGLAAVLSRLARLDAARFTSPVPPASPLWAAEAAVLADRAGLHSRARAQARQAAGGLVRLLSRAPVPDELRQAALAVAALAEADIPEIARRLRESVRDARVGLPGQRLARQAEMRGPADCPGRRPRGAAGEHVPEPRCSLDPSLVPEGVFLHGLTPCSDLLVQFGREQDNLVVEAKLAPGADQGALSRCRARIVDPAARRILAQESFSRAGSRARAELQLPSPAGDVDASWVEVVDDEHRPVRSDRSRRLRRALRWADAAVRAQQRPQGLAPGFTGEDWTTLAATAWRHCQYNWASTGDTNRAYLAAARLAAPDPPSRPPEPPSSWAAQLAACPPLEEPAFLAEVVGG